MAALPLAIEPIQKIRFGDRLESHIELDPELEKFEIPCMVLQPLVENSIKYAIAHSIGGGAIGVSAKVHAQQLLLEVADDGTGIADSDKIRLFEPNFSTKKTGMGLGLTIVNSIVSDHNGLIRVQDNSPQGAKFVIELPA